MAVSSGADNAHKDYRMTMELVVRHGLTTVQSRLWKLRWLPFTMREWSGWP